MRHSPFVSIIIVSWNSQKYLQTCLDKLSLQTFQNFEVILVDNGSSDGSLDGITTKCPSLTMEIVYLDKNLGFAKANNIGAGKARGQWIALLNTDAFPEPTWLENLIRAASEHQEYSCFSSRQIQANNPEFLDGAGDAYHVSGLAWKYFLGYPSNEFGLTRREVFSPCGAAALYPRQAFLDANGFDEDFFSYMEDVDLGFRLRLQGHRCLYVPDAVVYHIGSASLGVVSDFALYHYHRNLVWSFVQNMPSRLFWKYLVVHVAANIIYVANYTLRRRGKVLWKAKIAALAGLAKALQKRREIQAHRSVNDRDLLAVMEQGWLQPYVLGYNLRKVNSNRSKIH